MSMRTSRAVLTLLGLCLLSGGAAAARHGPRQHVAQQTLPNLPGIQKENHSEVASIRARHPRIELYRQRYLVKLKRPPSEKKQQSEAKVQSRIDKVARKLANRSGNKNVLIILEGDNGAGKSSTIRRMETAFQKTGVKYRVVHFGAPPAGANAMHWFEQYFKQLPRNGEVVIFDRSWYGRTVWETYHGLIKDKTARQSLKQIKAFEKGLGPQVKILKYFFSVSPDRQAKTIGKREARGGEGLELSDYTGLRDRSQIKALYKRAIDGTKGWHAIPMDNRAKGRLQMFRSLDRALFE